MQTSRSGTFLKKSSNVPVCTSLYWFLEIISPAPDSLRQIDSLRYRQTDWVNAMGLADEALDISRTAKAPTHNEWRFGDEELILREGKGCESRDLLAMPIRMQPRRLEEG